MGSILVLLGTLIDDLRMALLWPCSLVSLLKDPPLEVGRAVPRLTSRGECSSWTEDRLSPPMMGSTFLGYSSLKDFFLVC